MKKGLIAFFCVLMLLSAAPSIWCEVDEVYYTDKLPNGLWALEALGNKDAERVLKTYIMGLWHARAVLEGADKTFSSYGSYATIDTITEAILLYYKNNPNQLKKTIVSVFFKGAK